MLSSSRPVARVACFARVPPKKHLDGHWLARVDVFDAAGKLAPLIPPCSLQFLNIYNTLQILLPYLF